jgi:hypothetical protein
VAIGSSGVITKPYKMHVLFSGLQVGAYRDLKKYILGVLPVNKG